MTARRRWPLIVALVGVAVLTACPRSTVTGPGPSLSAANTSLPASTPSTPTSRGRATMSLSSSAFAGGAMIPVKYSCNVPGPPSPPLAWSGVPQGTAELALIVEDPDAPNGGFVHWLLYGLPPDLNGLQEGSPPAEARQGANGRGQNRWQGPCPPPGNPPHHYVFTLTALSRPLGLGAGATAPQVKEAMRGLTVGQAVLIGRFGR